MASALNALNLGPESGKSFPGLVPVRGKRPRLNLDEEVALRRADTIGDIDYVFFRRFSDGRSSQVAACVIDNHDSRFSERELAGIHQKLWWNGGAPLLYVGWQTRVDVLSCARGPDFWKQGDILDYNPAETIETAGQISDALQSLHERFSAARLSNGTFWEDAQNAKLVEADKAAHRRLIRAVVETDLELEGGKKPLLRRLLLLVVLIKYLEDRNVFPDAWFGRFCKGCGTFFEVLQEGSPDNIRSLLDALENKFNGDVFCLGESSQHRLTTGELRRFAELVEARTIKAQRYLWATHSFEHIPVEVLSHLYQRFAQPGKGAVFTPPFLATLILDYVLPYERLTGKEMVLDPTCGSGVFLVGAFRRLVHHWQSQHDWRRPDVATLKEILKRSIFGVELQEEAVQLAAFSLALAVCDALQPNVIWRDLRFDKLKGSSLLSGDFFSHLDAVRRLGGKDGFSIIVGNPPFLSKLSEAAKKKDGDSAVDSDEVPDNQMAYRVAHEAMTLLKHGGRMCLIQPHGFLYNANVSQFRREFITNNRVDAVLDFCSIRKLYDGKDPKTIAVLATRRKPRPEHSIDHLTFRRTLSVHERLGFELDHYDKHAVPQCVAEQHDWVWRANLLGGGRLQQLTGRLADMPSLIDYIRGKGWSAGEGFIVGNRQTLVPWLTGKDYLPSTAITKDGINRQELSKVEERYLEASRTEDRYTSPLFLVREIDSLPCAYLERGFLAFGHQVVSIHAPQSEAAQLKSFHEQFSANRSALSAFCALLGTRAFTGKATSILKRDIDSLPWPSVDKGWQLSFWEKVLCEDIIEHMAEYVRLGQNSKLLRDPVSLSQLAEYSSLFVKLLGSVYTNLRAVRTFNFDGLACQALCFGDRPELQWPNDWKPNLRNLIYSNQGEALRAVRVLRFYEANTILIVKPDRLRYWIRSTAIQDADETLTDLRGQGY
jgi:methylase of polypeptide subunit release factors